MWAASRYQGEHNKPSRVRQVLVPFANSKHLHVAFLAGRVASTPHRHHGCCWCLLLQGVENKRCYELNEEEINKIREEVGKYTTEADLVSSSSNRKLPLPQQQQLAQGGSQ